MSNLKETVRRRLGGAADVKPPVHEEQTSDQDLRDMMDALPAAIYTTDAEGRLTYFNPACVAFSGRTPEVGNDRWSVTWKMYHPDGEPMPHDQCPMAVALRTGEAISGVEAIAERPDGTRIWFTPYPTPLFDEQGNIAGGINILLDITHRKEAEQALRGSRETSANWWKTPPSAFTWWMPTFGWRW